MVGTRVIPGGSRTTFELDEAAVFTLLLEGVMEGEIVAIWPELDEYGSLSLVIKVDCANELIGKELRVDLSPVPPGVTVLFIGMGYGGDVSGGTSAPLVVASTKEVCSRVNKDLDIAMV